MSIAKSWNSYSLEKLDCIGPRISKQILKVRRVQFCVFNDKSEFSIFYFCQ